MTYEENETGVESRNPIELYHFHSPSDDWYYTSANRSINYDVDGDGTNELFEDIAISRSNPGLSSKINQQKLTLTAPKDFPVIQPYRITPPQDKREVKIIRYHEGNQSESVVFWQGTIQSVAWDRGDKAQVQLKPLSGHMEDNGLRKHFQFQCNHILYGDACGLDEANYSHQGEILSIDRTGDGRYEIASTNPEPDGWYNNGFFVVGQQRQLITNSKQNDSSTDVEMLTEPEGVAVGDTATIYAGCDRNMDDCKNKFSNLDNFGGFPFIPDRNPFREGIFD